MAEKKNWFCGAKRPPEIFLKKNFRKWMWILTISPLELATLQRP